MTNLTTQGTDALKMLKELPPEQQKKVIEDANSNLPKSDRARTVLWMTLLIGLFVIAGVCVWGGVTTAAEKDAAPLYLIATAVVSGTLGLFAKSPTSQ